MGKFFLLSRLLVNSVTLLSATLSTPMSVDTTTPMPPAPPETLQLFFLLVKLP